MRQPDAIFKAQHAAKCVCFRGFRSQTPHWGSFAASGGSSPQNPGARPHGERGSASL